MVHFVDLGGNGKGADLSPRSAAKKRHSFPSTTPLPGSGTVTIPVPPPPPPPPVGGTTYYYAPIIGRGY